MGATDLSGVEVITGMAGAGIVDGDVEGRDQSGMQHRRVLGKPSSPLVISRTTCRLETLTPTSFSNVVSRSIVTCPCGCSIRQSRLRFRPYLLLQRRGKLK